MPVVLFAVPLHALPVYPWCFSLLRVCLHSSLSSHKVAHVRPTVRAVWPVPPSPSSVVVVSSSSESEDEYFPGYWSHMLQDIIPEGRGRARFRPQGSFTRDGSRYDELDGPMMDGDWENMSTT